MARGFESKDVEFQQEERQRGRESGREVGPAERDRQEKRRSLELSLAKVRSERQNATNPHHQRMLDLAIELLERELGA